MSRFRSIVITGASSGIGEALALGYARPSVTLALTGRDAARLIIVAEACEARGATVVAEVIDVADRNAMAAWLTEFDDNSPVDLVIANAGISPDIENARLSDLALAHDTMKVNVGGIFNTVLPLLPRLTARRHGQIAVMASLASFFGLPYAATYNASKAAVRVWGESLRYALADAGVGVTVICPGFVVSRITERWPYVMPLLVPASSASTLIRRGLERNQTRITFPILLRAGIWLVGLVPAAAAAFLMRTVAQRR